MFLSIPHYSPYCHLITPKLPQLPQFVGSDSWLTIEVHAPSAFRLQPQNRCLKTGCFRSRWKNSSLQTKDLESLVSYRPSKAHLSPDMRWPCVPLSGGKGMPMHAWGTLGECSSQGWPEMARSGQHCEKKQSLSHAPEPLPQLASKEEPLWGFWKDLLFGSIICAEAWGLLLVRRVLSLPAKWFQHGHRHWRRKSLGRRVWQFGLDRHASNYDVTAFVVRCWARHLMSLGLSSVCERDHTQSPPSLTFGEYHLWHSASPALLSLVQGDLSFLFNEVFIN